MISIFLDYHIRRFRFPIWGCTCTGVKKKKRIHLYPSLLKVIQSKVSEKMRQIDFERAFTEHIWGLFPRRVEMGSSGFGVGKTISWRWWNGRSGWLVWCLDCFLDLVATKSTKTQKLGHASYFYVSLGRRRTKWWTATWSNHVCASCLVRLPPCGITLEYLGYPQYHGEPFTNLWVGWGSVKVPSNGSWSRHHMLDLLCDINHGRLLSWRRLFSSEYGRLLWPRPAFLVESRGSFSIC